VRAVLVVVLRVDVRDALEVTTAEDQEPVEALVAQALDPALGVRLRSWRSHRRLDYADAFAAEDLVEVRGELAVAVADQETDARAWGALIRSSCKSHGFCGSRAGTGEERDDLRRRGARTGACADAPRRASHGVGFANSSAALRRVGLVRFGALAVVEGGLFALVVRVSRCPEPVRAGLAAGTAASLEGVGDPRPSARAGDPPPPELAAEANAG
jgi:hypothetical protein